MGHRHTFVAHQPVWWDIGPLIGGIGLLWLHIGPAAHTVCNVFSPPMVPPSGLTAPASMEIPLFTPSNAYSQRWSVNVYFYWIHRYPAIPNGGFNFSPSAGLPARLSRWIIDLEFMDMPASYCWICGMRILNHSWCSMHMQLNPHRMLGKAPVQLRYLECFSRMAVVLVIRFPNKDPGLWAY